jgi:small subunit ribosomal protein S8
MVTDPIADLLTRIRNASRARHVTVTVPASKSKERVLNVLKEEGFVDRVDTFKDQSGKSFMKVFLRYDHAGAPVIREIRRLSKPGRREYVRKDQIPYHRGGLGTVIVSTSRGMLSDREARKLGVGGELICSVF